MFGITHTDSWSDQYSRKKEEDRRWVYWTIVHRLDSLSVWIRKHRFKSGDNEWDVDMNIFRAGMAIEALRMTRIATWAAAKRVDIHKNIPPIYRRIVAASNGDLDIDQALFTSDEIATCNYECRMKTSTDTMDMRERDRAFDKAMKSPISWWFMLAPEAPGTSGPENTVDMIFALRHAQKDPEFKVGPHAENLEHLLDVLESCRTILGALGRSEEEQSRRINAVLSNDERELIFLYRQAYPNAVLTADEQDSLDGRGRAGENVTDAVLAAVSHEE